MESVGEEIKERSSGEKGSDSKFMLLLKNVSVVTAFFLNWYSLHARLNSHYEACNYKKKKL